MIANKKITITPVILTGGGGTRLCLSLQLHHHRSEHGLIVRGTAEVVNDRDVYILSENESTYIPVGMKHRLSNPWDIPREIIAVQSGEYLG